MCFLYNIEIYELTALQVRYRVFRIQKIWNSENLESGKNRGIRLLAAAPALLVHCFKMNLDISIAEPKTE